MSTLFERIANSLTARDVARPLPCVSAGDTFGSAFEQLLMAGYEWGLCLVREGRRHVGWVDCLDAGDSENYERRISEVPDLIQPIRAEQIVAIELAVAEILPVLIHESLLFVTTRDQITHVLDWDSLDGDPFKYCLMALPFDIEHCLDSLIREPFAECDRRLALLSPAHQESAREFAERSKAKRPHSPHPLWFVSFWDKALIALRDADIKTMLPFATGEAAEAFLKRVRDLRNDIAHGHSILPLFGSVAKLAVFVSEMNRLVNHLTQITESEAADST